MIKKKIIFLALLNSLMMASIAFADQKEIISRPGFAGPDAGGEMSVKDLLANSQDNIRVILKGYVTKRISHDKYVFTDNTAEIAVEIDNKNMPLEQITPKTLVRLYGKVDKDYFPSKIEVDVKSVEVLK